MNSPIAVFFQISFIVCFLIFMGVGLSKENTRIADVKESTEYVKILNKDHKDMSLDVLHTDYQHVVYVERYDKDCNVLVCNGAWWLCDVETVTKHEYDQLKVGKMYSVDRIKSFAYMKK